MAFPKKNGGKKNVEYGEVVSFEILKATQFNWGVSFNMVLNGVTIYSCTVAETKDGKQFISFPSRKGSDGKWYSYVHFRFSDADLEAILDAVEKAL